MHVWETVSQENVLYILNRTDIETLQPLKFYILRGQETLYGHLRLERRQRGPSLTACGAGPLRRPPKN